VHPIPKTTSLSNPVEYRPISILPTISKVLEKVVRKQIEQYLQKLSLLNDQQSGFGPGRNTGTALLNVIEDARTAIDNRNVTIFILLDFSKAYDSVDHDILLEKLKILGFAEPTRSWFFNYLTSRKQRVVPGSRSSKCLKLNCGVAQGTVLGPLAYVNDVGDALKHCKNQMYVDELQIYLSGQPSQLSLAQKSNNDLMSLSNWAYSLGLRLNPNKSQCMLISSKSILNKISSVLRKIYINDSVLPWCSEVKNLGVLIDNTRSWNSLVDSTCRKVFASMHAMKRFYLLVPVRFSLNHLLCHPLIIATFFYPT